MKERPVLVHGGIIHEGKKQGTALGFPTANVAFHDPTFSGTYAGRAIIGGGIYRAAIYANPQRDLLEAHILGIDLDLYGKWMTLELYKKVAENEEFKNETHLKDHIKESIQKVHNYFAF